jgi:hypothetical protein
MRRKIEITNPFEALCVLASRRNYCWKLYCTTCGAMDIRTGFMLIAKGYHPQPSSFNWDLELYKLKRSMSRDWTEEMTTKFISELSNASLEFISDNCTFPDWLGYLGLILHQFHYDFSNRIKISNAWKPQLDAIVKKIQVHQRIDTRIDDIALLTWESLKIYESLLK